jgi:hypothetical protein
MLMAVSRATWPERTGGSLATMVHERESWLAREIREVQGVGYACWFGQRGREGARDSRWTASVSVQSGCKGEGWGLP